MIIRAIEALNDPNELNKSSISKYIESTYGDLPVGHSTFLFHCLNRMKDTGELVFVQTLRNVMHLYKRHKGFSLYLMITYLNEQQ